MYAENQIYYASFKKNLQKTNDKPMRLSVTKFMSLHLMY